MKESRNETPSMFYDHLSIIFPQNITEKLKQEMKELRLIFDQRYFRITNQFDKDDSYRTSSSIIVQFINPLIYEY